MVNDLVVILMTPPSRIKCGHSAYPPPLIPLFPCLDLKVHRQTLNKCNSLHGPLVVVKRVTEQQNIFSLTQNMLTFQYSRNIRVSLVGHNWMS